MSNKIMNDNRPTINFKQEVEHTFISKQKYISLHGINRKFANILLMIADKTTLMVSNATNKVIADKFCERFGINCTVKVADHELSGLKCDQITIDDAPSDTAMKNIHFTRMLGKLLNK